MLLTDTHTHQYYQADTDSRAASMERCFEKGIARLFLPNVDLASIAMIDNLVSAYPNNCFAMLGLHPCDVKTDWQSVLAQIMAALPGRKVYAIGEIGIDLYWDKSTLLQQQSAFKKQLAWAKELDLPVVIHCRDAFDQVFEVLAEVQHEKMRGIFHCFTGTLEQAQKVIDLGFYVGIGGVVTYKNSGLDKIVEQIDLKHIVLETDSPYLTPVPYRGKPNESSYLIYVAQKIADIHQVSIEIVAAVTTENSRKIFAV